MVSKPSFPIHNHPNGPAWCRGPTVMDDILNRKQGKKPKRVKMAPQAGATKGRQGSTISVTSKDSIYDGYDYLDTLQRTASGRGLYIHDRVTIQKEPLKKRLREVFSGNASTSILRSRRSEKYETVQWGKTRSGKTLCRTSERTVLPKETADEIALLAARAKNGVFSQNGDDDEDEDDEDENPDDYLKRIPATRRVFRMHAR